MSLILEALKKSEAKRRLGAAPDLGTPFASPRRRSPIVPIIIVVLIAMALVWWAVRRPAAEAPAQKTATQSTIPPAPAVQHPNVPLRSVTGDNTLERTPPPANLAAKPMPPSASSDPFTPMQPPSIKNDPAARASLKEMRDKRRAGMNRGDNSAPATGTGQLTLPRTQPAAPPNTPAVAAAPPRPAPAPPATVVAPAPTPVAAAPAPAVATSAPKATDASSPAAQVATRAPKTPGTIGMPVSPPPAQQGAPAKQGPSPSAQPYSELPFSVRKALPELRLSMHVYATDPAQRFVILNDSRIGEGDKTTDDVFVREIRPDGVVLEFQSQRFFYPRDGL